MPAAPYTLFEFTVRSSSALAINALASHAGAAPPTVVALTSALVLAHNALEWHRTCNRTPWRHASTGSRHDRLLAATIEGAGLGAMTGGLTYAITAHALPALAP